MFIDLMLSKWKTSREKTRQIRLTSCNEIQFTKHQFLKMKRKNTNLHT